MQHSDIALAAKLSKRLAVIHSWLLETKPDSGLVDLSVTLSEFSLLVRFEVWNELIHREKAYIIRRLKSLGVTEIKLGNYDA